jgi:hypothetical protein
MKRANTHKDNHEDPYHSQSENDERIAFDKRNFRIRVAIVLAIPVILVLLYFAIDYATGF